MTDADKYINKLTHSDWKEIYWIMEDYYGGLDPDDENCKWVLPLLCKLTDIKDETERIATQKFKRGEK